ncbi:MAG: hypothetical protein NVS3B28_18350 [Candidatus Velthaea sp.]
MADASGGLTTITPEITARVLKNFGTGSELEALAGKRYQQKKYAAACVSGYLSALAYSGENKSGWVPVMLEFARTQVSLMGKSTAKPAAVDSAPVSAPLRKLVATAGASRGAAGAPPIGKYDCYSDSYYTFGSSADGVGHINTGAAGNGGGSFTLGAYMNSLHIMPGRRMMLGNDEKYSSHFHMNGSTLIAEEGSMAKAAAAYQFNASPAPMSIEIIYPPYSGQRQAVRCQLAR